VCGQFCRSERLIGSVEQDGEVAVVVSVDDDIVVTVAFADP